MISLLHEARSVGPAMHALIIGVGGYPYLPGGERADPRHRLAFDGMGQLTSPPRSALAFARRLIDGGTSIGNLPLGTVDLLMSCAAGDTVPHRPDPAPREATIDNIRDAFEGWLERCAADPDNAAVLYFCGHGLQSDAQLLLAADFNRHGATPFAQAIDFDETRLALQQRGPRTQVFVIDACRTDCFDLRPAGVQPLASPDLFAYGVCENELTLRMPAFSEAWGRRDDVSHLTGALLRALDGQAATTDESGRWVVSMAGIRRSIDLLLMEEMNVASLHRGVEANNLGDAVICVLDRAPSARLTVSFRPAEPDLPVSLTCTPLHPDDLPAVDCGRARYVPRDARGPAADEWRMTVRAGIYTLRAKSAAADVSRPHSVYPPHSRADFQESPCLPD
ncbi:caspase family protein [Embleya sp. NPDC059237]|uniref:caspase family protein n=1 Tax=Embleya sp. NPDC059237 TaxID=3346784 RepID=UPI0036ABC806